MTYDIERLEDLLPTAELDPLRTGGRRTPRPRQLISRDGPGLALVAVCVTVAFGVNHLVPSLSPLVVSVVIGAILANLGAVPAWSRGGTHFAAKRLLRVGVVLLGFQLAISQVVSLGGPAVAVVVATVAITFFGTQWLGRRLGLTSSLSLLIATGFAICGASAVAAMEGVADAEEEEVAFSIALVTLCGSLAIFVLPLLRGPLGLVSPASFGSWVGASVHDVGQVVATAAGAGNTAVRAAVIVKLTRVVLLAPMVAGVGLARRRRTASEVAGPDDSRPSTTSAEKTTRRPPLLPLFVAGFLVAIAVRSSGVLPASWLHPLKVAQDVTLAAALVGLGTGVQAAKLRKVGGRPLLLGLLSWVLVGSIAYAGVMLIGA
ncbi:MAG: putative sulfate exporter family transporter [Acidimicrobiales bacterium]